MKSTLVTIVSLVVLAGVLTWLTIGAQQVECEVCIDFKGRRNCATAAAATKDEAVRSGRTTACGLLASGVRDGFACDATQPSLVKCK
ncbi:MAG: hypothetical protein P8R42_29605 [Candidatus Binatia bacterium]|nr:hypothetical protein [Candidatus Binatia bacterium]